MTGIQLKAAPKQLRQKADEIQRQIQNAERDWNALCETVRASRYYWEGEAADRGRDYLEKMTPDVQTVFRRLKEHPADLLEMAGVYTEAEEKASALAESLPVDVIQ